MALESKKQTGLMIGAVVGALLGAGAAYLLITNPAERELGELPDPIKAKDIVALTGAAAALLRTVDDFRRRV